MWNYLTGSYFEVSLKSVIKHMGTFENDFEIKK